MEKVAVYLRVSTKAQIGRDKYGMINQFEDCRKFCKEQEYKIVSVYRDKGVSGALNDRPGLNKLFNDVKERKFSKVIVAKLDRIARDLAVQLWVDKELQVNEAEMISVAEPFSSGDYMMNAMRQIVGVFAELEKNRIADRLLSGRMQKRRKGGHIGGQDPLGYYSIKGSKRLYINDSKSATVKRVFELKGTMSLQKIADKLNEEGHTTRDNKTFTAMQVKRIYDREKLYNGNMEAPAII